MIGEAFDFGFWPPAWRGHWGLRPGGISDFGLGECEQRAVGNLQHVSTLLPTLFHPATIFDAFRHALCPMPKTPRSPLSGSSQSPIRNPKSAIEYTFDNLNADPSQGSHFFHNITSLGIGYLTVCHDCSDFIDWKWMRTLPTEALSTYLNHVKLDTPLTIKIEGKKSQAVIIQKRP